MLVMAACSRSTGGVGVSGGVQDINSTIGAKSTHVGIQGTNSSSTGADSTTNDTQGALEGGCRRHKRCHFTSDISYMMMTIHQACLRIKFGHRKS